MLCRSNEPPRGPHAELVTRVTCLWPAIYLEGTGIVSGPAAIESSRHNRILIESDVREDPRLRSLSACRLKKTSPPGNDQSSDRMTDRICPLGSIEGASWDRFIKITSSLSSALDNFDAQLEQTSRLDTTAAQWNTLATSRQRRFRPSARYSRNHRGTAR